MAIVIAPDGSQYELVGEKPKGYLSLQQCQKAVGGYIERVCLPGGTAPKGTEMIVDEEGTLKPDPVLNPAASLIAGQPIFGTVILVKAVGPEWK
jgi:hypothetical protein